MKSLISFPLKVILGVIFFVAALVNAAHCQTGVNLLKINGTPLPCNWPGPTCTKTPTLTPTALPAGTETPTLVPTATQTVTPTPSAYVYVHAYRYDNGDPFVATNDIYSIATCNGKTARILFVYAWCTGGPGQWSLGAFKRSTPTSGGVTAVDSFLGGWSHPVGVATPSCSSKWYQASPTPGTGEVPLGRQGLNLTPTGTFLYDFRTSPPLILRPNTGDSFNLQNFSTLSSTCNPAGAYVVWEEYN